jgi:hypothetical protein
MLAHARCKKCSDIAKRKTAHRVGVGGYIYGAERIARPGGKTRGKPVHIEIAERVLGRPLKKGEVVHHINCRRDDNRNSNLLICSSKYHSWLHWQYAQRFAALHLTRED